MSGAHSQGGSGVADTMKIAWNVRSVKRRRKCCGEVKKITKAATRCNRREAGRVDCDI